MTVSSHRKERDAQVRTVAGDTKAIASQVPASLECGDGMIDSP